MGGGRAGAKRLTGAATGAGPRAAIPGAPEVRRKPVLTTAGGAVKHCASGAPSKGLKGNTVKCRSYPRNCKRFNNRQMDHWG